MSNKLSSLKQHKRSSKDSKENNNVNYTGLFIFAIQLLVFRNFISMVTVTENAFINIELLFKNIN